MKKAISAILSLALVLTSAGCAGMKTTGKPFCKEGTIEELTDYLNQGIGKATREEVKAKLNGASNVSADATSERWIYKYSTTKSKYRNYILFTNRRDTTQTNELEIVFDQNRLLKSYGLKNQCDESVERADKTNSFAQNLTDSLVTGAIGAVVLVTLEIIRDWLKKHI